MMTEEDGMIVVDETAGTVMIGIRAVTVTESVIQTILATVIAKVAETVMEEIAIDVVTVVEKATKRGTVIDRKSVV